VSTSTQALESARLALARADELSALTEEPGRITRAYGTPSLARAASVVAGWMEAADMVVRQDAIGNVIGRWEPAGPSAGTFVLGSHIDSVRNAGRYDGPLGVLVAVAAVETLRDRGAELPFAVEVVAFIDEEGLRYVTSYLGSRVYAGIFDLAELDERDAAGVALCDAVRAQGGDPSAIADARRTAEDLLGYLEIHIEQGPVLEHQNLPLGVVTSIAGQSRGLVRFVGRAGHAGTVPMWLRQDALCGAAEMVLAIERLATEREALIGTAGQISAAPSAGNVIPGAATISFDVRHQDDAQRLQAVTDLQAFAEEVCARRGLVLDWRTLQEHEAVPCADRLAGGLREAIVATGGRAHTMMSGAGHDAVSMAEVTDVAMLFVRCKNGVSHHPDESVQEPDVAAAISVTATFLHRLIATE
jgi:allantoate deiminase